MDFGFSDEQQLLLDTIRRFAASRYSFAQRRSIMNSPGRHSPAVWKGLADLGILAINIPADHGGLGGGAVETLLASLAIGESLLLEPFHSSAVIATRAIATLGSDVQRSQWLPALATGELIAVLAHDASFGHGAGEPVRAIHRGGNWELSGRIPVVYHAPLAELLLVTAATGQAENEVDALFAVSPTAHGVVCMPLVTVDGQIAADVELDAVSVQDSSRLGCDVRDGLDAVLDYGLFALCAETIGVLDQSLGLTIEYARTRNQFGGPIARFQALQHRMVDMLIHVEQARSMVYLASSSCTAEESARQAVLSATKVQVNEAARYVGQQAVQLHGGMGVSDEVAISHFFKRLVATGIRFGSTDAHVERYERHLAIP